LNYYKDEFPAKYSHFIKHHGFECFKKGERGISYYDAVDLIRTIVTNDVILADKGVNYHSHILGSFIDGCHAKVNRIFESYFFFKLEQPILLDLNNSLLKHGVDHRLLQNKAEKPDRARLNLFNLCYKIMFIYYDSPENLKDFKNNLEIVLPYFMAGQENLGAIYLLSWFAMAILNMQDKAVISYKHAPVEKAWYRLEKWYIPFLQNVAESAIQNLPIPGPGSEATNIAIAHHLEHFSHTIIVRLYKKYFKNLDVYDSKEYLSAHFNTSKDKDPRRYNPIIKDLVALEPSMKETVGQLHSPVLAGLLGKIFSISMDGFHDQSNPNFQNCLTENTILSIKGYIAVPPADRKDHQKFYVARTFLLLNFKLAIDRYIYRHKIKSFSQIKT